MISQRHLFLQHVAQTTDFPMGIEVERAEGVYLYSPDGKRYLDLISGISVSNIGHRHPVVLKAIHDQLDKYMHLMVYGEYVQSPQVKLATALANALPAPLDSVYFVNSGSEAIEGALKLAKRVTRRAEIISFRNAYHGSTHGALSIQGSETYKSAFRPLLPDCRLLDYNDFEQLEHISADTAAVVVEAVQAEAGIVSPAPGYLEAIRERCNETCTLLILDEVQTGFGRTGKLFGMEHSGIVPDIVCLAKGMGGGMPIGAFVASKKMMHTLASNPILGHISTFGGHPVSCAASLATLEVLTNSELIDQVESKSQRFVTQLRHTAIQEVRSNGLMLAVEVESFDFLQKVIHHCLELGLIVDWFLFNDRSMRIGPPLTISNEQIDFACETILKALDRALDQ